MAVALAACSTRTGALYPPNGTLLLTVQDSSLLSQGAAVPGPQIAIWTVTEARVDLANVGSYSVLGMAPCFFVQRGSIRQELAAQCNGSGVVLAPSTFMTANVDLAITRLSLRRSWRPDVRPDGTADPQGDFDGDAIANSVDNCMLVPNSDQKDSNSDGHGDACSQRMATADPPSEPDDDLDGVVNLRDNCVWASNPAQDDSDADGIGDVCEEYFEVDLGGPAFRRTFVNVPFTLDPSRITRLVVDFGDAIVCGAPGRCSLLPDAVKVAQAS